MKQVIAIVLIFFANMMFAEKITFSKPAPNSVKTVNGSVNTRIFTNTISEMDVDQIAVQGQNFTVLNLDGYVYHGEIGHPKLPAKTQLLNVPMGAEVKVKILSSKYTDIKLSKKGFNEQLFPVQPPVRKNASEEPKLVKDLSAYNQKSFNTRSLVSVGMLGIAKDQQLAQLDICPVQYLPSKNIIRVYYYIEFELVYEGGQPQSKADLKGVGKPKVYQIISDRKFEAALAPFITWKTEMGFDVRIRYTDVIGGTGATLRTNIKNYLKGIYDNPATRADFLLLVGDHAEIPAHPSQVPNNNTVDNDHITDLYYAEYTGDYLPDIRYGRMSATTVQQLNNQLEKMFAMEKLTVPSTDFIGKTMLIAGYDGSSSWHAIANATVNYGKNYYFNTANGVTATVLNAPASQNQEASIKAFINNGGGFVNYTAHCDYDQWWKPQINTGDVPNFTNLNKYPLMIANCCLSGRFDTTQCLAEAMLRAEKKGAVAYIGTTNSSYWYEDLQWSLGTVTSTLTSNPANITYNNSALGVYDRSWHTHGEQYNDWAQTTSDMVYWGNTQVQLSSALSSSNSTTMGYMKRYYWEIYTVFGDPSYIHPFIVPQPLTVNHPDGLTANMTEVEITATNAPYAYVGFTMDGQLLGGGTTDSLGHITFTFSEDLPVGDAKLVVTAHNKIPYIVTLPIGQGIPEAPDAVTNLTVTPDANGALTAAISWTNPTTNQEGDLLTSLTAVNVYVNDVELPTYVQPSPTIGGPGSHNYIAATAGAYTFKVAAANTAGEGRIVKTTVWIGPDVPSAPDSVVLTRNNMNALLSWVAPKTGMNGGYFITGLVYDVFRMPGNVSVATGLTTASFSELITTSGDYSYKVVARNSTGEGGNATSNILNFCANITAFPWTVGFEGNGANFPICWSQEFVSGDVNWVIGTASASSISPTTVHGGTYKAYLYNASNTAKKTKLITPSLDLSTTGNPVLKFWHTQKVWVSDQDELRVFYRTSSSGSWVQLQAYTSNVSDWTERTISLPNPSGDYYIAFEGTTKYGYGVQLDDISITGDAKQNGATVATPQLDDVTENSITILPVTAPTNGQTVEYAITNSSTAVPAVWQDGLTFGGLAHSTTYYIVARSKTNTTYLPGALSAPLVVTTATPIYTVTITQTTGGTVSVSNGGVSVDNDTMLNHGTVLTLTAIPDEGYEFVEWWHNGTDPIQTYVLIEDVVISATFAAELTTILASDQKTLLVYPNPVTDVLNIQSEQPIKQITVLDMNGKTVKSLRGNRNTVDLQSVPVGHYMVNIHTKTGVVTVKIVKR